MTTGSLFPKKKDSGNPPYSFRFIDLFAGIGGMRIAFEDAGGTCVFSSEWDKYAQETYEANFGEKPEGDITQIEADIIPDFEVLVGGFPCQPFSSIGKREGFGHSTQGTLFYDIVRILEEKQPESFLLENVEGLVTHDGGKTFRVISDSLDDLGYFIAHKILDAADYGVPQHRKRIYIVGFRKNLGIDPELFQFPEPHPKPAFIGNFIEHHATGYAISKHLQKVYLFKKNDGRPEIIDRHSQIQVKTLVSTYHKIQRLTGTFVRDGETGLRLLSRNECKAIMGFPLDFKTPVSRTQMYRQFGNSVAVPVVKEIAKKLVEVLEQYHQVDNRV